MAKSNARDSIKLTSVDDLFSTQESRADEQREKVLDIPLSEISDFHNHPFKVKADEAMLEMADSIKQYGVLVPALVRPKEGGGYEMVAGHRRKKASELAGRESMPCIVRDLAADSGTLLDLLNTKIPTNIRETLGDNLQRLSPLLNRGSRLWHP